MTDQEIIDECKRRREEWLKTRPLPIQQLAKEYPIGCVFHFPDGMVKYLTGYVGDSEKVEGLHISPINPTENWDEANRLREFIHIQCLLDAGIRVEKRDI